MSGLKIDQEMLRSLAAMMVDKGLSELEWCEGDCRLKLSRTVTVAAPTVVAAAPAAEPAAAAAGDADEPAPASASVAGGLTSPTVGTAYLAPEPGAAPFVRVGDTVEEGDTVLIIEAMKVMNPIRAPRAGTVTRILIQDAQPVEFGELMMVIE